jgi:hypothetical protein
MLTTLVLAATVASGDVDPDLAPALETISAESLRTHLSFIASDELAGRDTPSDGLDKAAAYIADQFRSAGLEPVEGDSYYQTATLKFARRTAADFEMQLRVGDEAVTLAPDQITLMSDEPTDLEAARVIRADDASDFEGLDDETLDDAVIATHATGRGSFMLYRTASRRGVAAVLVIDTDSEVGGGLGKGRLVRSGRGGRGRLGLTIIRVHGSAAAQLDTLPVGLTDATATLLMPEIEPVERTAHNVVGILRGSDPDLRDTCVVVTAHYDHVGTGTPVDGDGIFNGANDDGSGTVTVIELASALTRAATPPRRSIVFMTVYGEEKGLLGSQHYIENPIFPLDKTVANVNLEHVGRTDDVEESKAGRVMLTGHGYSTVTDVFQSAADATSLELYHHPRNCDQFFGRSDNVAFARKGIPAHTLCTAFIFPEYHQRGDHWDLIDYDNMESVGRAVAIALWSIANDTETPRWTEGHRRTESYIEAFNELYGN